MATCTEEIFAIFTKNKIREPSKLDSLLVRCDMKKKQTKMKKYLYTLSAAVFWIGVWQAVSMIYDMDFVLPSPVRTLEVFIEKVCEHTFWSAVGFSVSRIMTGFFLSALLGICLALLSIRVKVIGVLLDPFCSVVRAVPVASFIILVLVMFSSEYVSVIISLLMGFPVIYSTLRRGIEASPRELIEAADVFCLGYLRRLVYIYVPHLVPYIASALSVACGLCFKSGIAAEVIGYPRGSVGEAMYLSKIGFNMPELLAYTAIIVVVSVLIEKGIEKLCRVRGDEK